MNSLSTGQVLSSAYTFDKAKLVVREMTDNLVLDLVAKKLVTDKMTLMIGYDIENLTDEHRRNTYAGPVERDWYGREVPKPSHGSIRLSRQTSSTDLITDAVMQLFDRVVDRNLLVRRMNVVAENTVDEANADFQLDLFDNHQQADERERRRQEAILAIKNKYGKNAILKGMNFEEGATAKDRNQQVGGHKA